MVSRLPLEGRGRWWVPGTRRKERGLLSVTQQGKVTLEFEEPTRPGWLPEQIAVDPSNAVAVFPALHGEIDAVPISLLDCQVQVSTLYQANRATNAIADSMIRGALVLGTMDKCFASVQIHLDHLTAWAHRASLVDSDVSPAVEISVPGQITAKGDTGTVDLRWIVERTGRATSEGMVRTLSEKTAFVVSNNIPFSAQDARREARRYQDLITLAAGVPAAFLSVSLIKARRRRGGSLPDSRIAEYIFPTVVKPEISSTPLVAQQMSFSLPTINFEDLVRLWPLVQEGFRGPIGALLGFRYSSEQYVENKVVLLIAAAEEAYRASGLPERLFARSQLKHVQTEVKRALGDTSFATFSAELAQQIDGRITLHKRLQGLAEHVDSVDSIFGNSENLRIWIEAAKKARNSLAHTAIAADDAMRLHAVAFAAEALVELAILKALGLTQTELKEVARIRYLSARFWIERSLRDVSV